MKTGPMVMLHSNLPPTRSDLKWQVAEERMTDLLQQVTKYGLVGVLNTAVGLSTIFLALALGASDIGANAIGYGVGLCLSYLMNRSWTFSHKGPMSTSFAKFIVVFGVAYLFKMAVVVFAHRTLSIDIYLAQIIGMVVYTLLFFLGSRFFAFRIQRSRTEMDIRALTIPKRTSLTTLQLRRR